MAAYAALVSVMHIIDNLRLHCRPPITLHKEQVHLLTEKVAFLQQFLQVYNPNLPYSKEVDPLESSIARAAYAAEDAIESHIYDRLTNNDGEKTISDRLYEALEKVIEDMALIQEEAMDCKKIENQLHAKSTTHEYSSGSTSSSSIQMIKSRMVGADDLLLQLKDKLTSNRHDLQTIPIVGMGGSGKTTLALNIYEDGLIRERFDIRAWVTISQKYSIDIILKQVLSRLIQESGEGELGEMLYKHLCGKRFLIILDDMWSVEAWDEVKWFFPDNKNGSRIVITTRLITLASALSNSYSLRMKLLDDDDSWDLLSKTVFGEKGCCCPSGFEIIGKKIGKSCKGLPLSIVVVGGLLAKSEQSIQSWEHVEENLNAIVNLEDDERCLKTLYMSYKQLPVHLKPCFLYIGIYREDHVIPISRLVKLRVAEGFLKPMSGKRPEDVARAYLMDLIDRNLVLIHEVGSIGSIKECKVHDLFRNLCLREALKEGLYTVYPGHEIKNEVCQIVMSGTKPEIEEIDASSSPPPARSLIFDLEDPDEPPHIFKFLRILGSDFPSMQFINNMHRLFISRFLTFSLRYHDFPSTIYLFWNLQTLIVTMCNNEGITMPTDIWYMSNIRHICFDDLYLPDPSNVEDGVVLENLQTVGRIREFQCSEQMVSRVPNIRYMKLFYKNWVDDSFCLSNLHCLDKLESLKCYFNAGMCTINYPCSLEKLTLAVDSSVYWPDILDKIGALPLLQKLKLYQGTFKGKWETTDGQFRSLKFLSLEWCNYLKVWTTEASHFPRLEQLHLHRVDELEEIPLDFAEISTLKLIDVGGCLDSAIESAKRILEEQEALYGEEEMTLQVRVELWDCNNQALKSLRCPNFHVK